MLITVESCLQWLKSKNGADLVADSDGESFYRFLLSMGVVNINQINEEHYYDWIDTRI